MFLGDFGTGKTTLAMRMLSHVYLTSVRAGQRARVAADSTKRSGNGAELDPFAEAHGTKAVDLLSAFSDGIQMLDPKLPLTATDHARNIEELLSDDGSLLNDDQKHMLRIGLHTELKKKENAHITQLNDFFATVNSDTYLNSVKELKLLSPGVVPRLSQEDIVNVGNSLYIRLSNFLMSESGRVLGGRQSLADAMSSHVVSFDYTRLDPEAIAQVQSFIARVRTSTIRHGDDRYFVDAELFDESYELWDSMSFALALRGRTKKLRGTGALLMFISQHISDYYAIPGPQGEIARNMLRDVGGWIIGQHDVEDLELIQKQVGISRTVASNIPMLGEGQFLAKFGAQPPFVFNYPLTLLYKQISDTDIATKRNLQRG
jgi:hypothetical protein